MNIAEINTLSKTWTEYLAGKSNLEFDELINISKTNRRVRNSAVFLFYTDDDFIQKFEERTYYDQDVKKMKFEFAKALLRLKSENNNGRNFAEIIENKYFKDIKIEVDSSTYDVSAEMAKFFNMMLNSFNLSKKDTKEKKLYRQNRIRNLNLNNLLH